MVSAQVHFGVDAPDVVAVGERFQLVFSADADFEQFSPPRIEGFDVLAGPSTSTMSTTNIINGKMTTTRTMSSTYILEASRVGKFTVGQASIVVKGKTYTSQPQVIEVVAGETPSRNATAPDAADRSSETGLSDPSGEDIFLRLQLSKRQVVKGESVVAVIKLYTRLDIAGFEDVKFPDFNGFWSQETYTPQNIDFQRETVNGRIYQSATLRRFVLQPQQTGTIAIEPAEMVCLVRIRNNARGRSLLDDFFDSYQTLRKRIKTPETAIKVAPLPAGAPASFNGAVGKFSMKTRLSSDSIKAHEAVSFYVTIQGQGNINLIEMPKLNFPPDFETYDSKVTDHYRSSGGTYSGRKEFEYPVIPRSHGDFTIAPVEFSYYDTDSRTYKTLKSKPIKIKVEKSGESGFSGTLNAGGVNRRSVQDLARDIRYIHTAPPKWRIRGQFFMFSPLFFIVLSVVLLLFAVVYRLLLKRRERQKDVVSVRNRKANKVAKLRLKTADILLRQELFSAFYEEIHRALWGYMSDKLGLAQAECSRDRVREILEQRGIAPEPIREFLDLIETCEFARYAPDPGQVEKEKIFARALTCISRLEQCLK